MILHATVAASCETKQQMQACSFRDSYEQFKKAGAEVVGVSGDSPESHKVLDATPQCHLSIHIHQIYVHILPAG